ncbi:MAG: TrkH family potassium uptake protein [Gaiellaceae bacterium]
MKAMPFARPWLGVEVGAALNLVGALLRYLSLAFLFPAVLALGYSEPVWPFLASWAIVVGVGAGLGGLTQGKEKVGVREGFLVVALTWLLAAAAVSLPYHLSGEAQLSRPLDAFFEAMSGMTTTGSSVLTDVAALDRSLLMWRQFSQWLGGMGIIVLALAVLPRLRVGGRQLMESELPGPELDTLAASIRETARRLWVLYVALTGILVLVLAALGWSGVDERMGLYEAVAHAFTTMPTGGFGTEPRSIEPFAPASQWVFVVFMALAGVNFALLYRAFVRAKPGALLRDQELRLYVGLLALASLAVVAVVWDAGLEEGEAALRNGVFQVVSIMTTTGYASTDFNEWLAVAPAAGLLLVALMFPGGSAGSTAGSIKVVRHLVIGKVLRRELDQTVHPEYVAPVRLNRVAVDERTVRAVIAFVLLYVGIFVMGAVLLLLDAHRVDLALSPFDAVAASATTLGNVGPAFGFAGPMGSFEPFSDVSKGIMIALMWIGRLEIVPVVALVTRAYWRA